MNVHNLFIADNQTEMQKTDGTVLTRVVTAARNALCMVCHRGTKMLTAANQYWKMVQGHWQPMWRIRSLEKL